MRIDKFLKVSRIIKRRTIANEACDAGRVEVLFGGKSVKIEVLSLKETTKKDEAQELFKYL